MRGILKTRSAGSQFLLLIGVCLMSLFLLGLIGTLALSAITGLSLDQFADPKKWNFADPRFIMFVRGMQVVQFISFFLVPVLICSWLFSSNSKQYLGLRKPFKGTYWIVGVAVMILAIPLVSWLGELNRNFQFPDEWVEWMRNAEEEAAKTIKGLLARRSPADLVINVVCIAALAAVGEELLFRGMVQRLLIKMFRNHWVGIIIAALLFSAMHMQFYGFLPRFILGIVLGIIYWYSGSLWTAMLAHFVYDALLIIIAYYNPEMLNEETPVNANTLAILGSISFVIVIALIEWMRKHSVANFRNTYADDEVPVKDHPF